METIKSHYVTYLILAFMPWSASDAVAVATSCPTATDLLSSTATTCGENVGRLLLMSNTLIVTVDAVDSNTPSDTLTLMLYDAFDG